MHIENALTLNPSHFKMLSRFPPSSSASNLQATRPPPLKSATIASPTPNWRSPNAQLQSSGARRPAHWPSCQTVLASTTSSRFTSLERKTSSDGKFRGLTLPWFWSALCAQCMRYTPYLYIRFGLWVGESWRVSAQVCMCWRDTRCWTFCFRTLQSQPPHRDFDLLFSFHHHLFDFVLGSKRALSERASLPFLVLVGYFRGRERVEEECSGLHKVDLFLVYGCMSE